VAGIVTGDNADGDELDDSTVLWIGHAWNGTSFTGEDLLFTRLATGNFVGFTDVTGTAEGELAFTRRKQMDLGAVLLLLPTD